MTKTKGGDAYAAIWEDEFEYQASRLSKAAALEEIKLALANLLKLARLLKQLCVCTWIVPEASLRRKESEIPVAGRVDLMAAYAGSSSVLKLIDWKLDRKQRYMYAPQLWLYAYLLDRTDRYQDSSYRYHPIPQWIKDIPKNLLEVNLLHGTVVEHEWDDQEVRDVENRIFRGIRRIRALVDGREPKQIHGGEFRVTENSINCNFCPFRQPCQTL